MSVAEKQLIDPTQGLELITGDEIALNATRHIFLAADLLDPRRSREIGMVRGGEELDNRCLRRTSGKLPRCTFTPMEYWGEPMPLELMPEGVRPLRLKGEQVQGIPAPVGYTGPAARLGSGQQVGPGGALVGTGADGNRQFISDVLFNPIYPGDHIRGAVATGRGIVEIEVLRTVDYGGIDREMEALFFPPDWQVPTAIRLIREHVEQVAESVLDADVRSIADNILTSIQESSEYMAGRIGAETSGVLQRVNAKGGHVYTYSRMGRSFAAQLEVRLNDMSDLVNQQVEKAAAGIDVQALAAMNQETIAAIGTMLTDALKTALASAAVKPVEMAADEPAPAAKKTK